MSEQSRTVSRTEMSEEELEDYLVHNPSQIKEGFTLLRQQFPTDTGPLDMLLMDEVGVIWIAELKVQTEDGHLEQGLRYYDYVHRRREAIARTISFIWSSENLIFC